MPLPAIPQNWTVRGDLPEIEPATAADDSLDLLDEDIVQIVDATGTFTLDVGWYPAASRTGKFLCRAVYSENWDCPLEELETASRLGVFHWIENWVSEIQNRIGEHGTLSNEVIATIIVSLQDFANQTAIPSHQPNSPPIAPTGPNSRFTLGTRNDQAYAT